MRLLTNKTLSREKTYRFKYQKQELVYKGMFQGWHSFARKEVPHKIWSEVLEHELDLLEEVTH